MGTHLSEDARSDPGRRTIKREVLVIALLAAALLIGGGVYTALRGTPPRPDIKGPIQVQTEGPATMPGGAQLPRHPPGDVPPSPPPAQP